MNMIVKDYTLIQLIIAELDDFIAKVAIKGSFSSERLKTYLTLHLLNMIGMIYMILIIEK